jgi:sugar/nucleoside kinase (ribokinase family)
VSDLENGVVDTTAAGDAFVGGFAVALAEGQDFVTKEITNETPIHQTH